MPQQDPKFDAYIEKSEDFAQPILIHLRKLVHKTCPDVKEVMKWSFPNFEYKGSILCFMSSFKAHCSFGFWLSSVMKDPQKIFNSSGESAMGQFGKIRSLKDLPADKIMISYLKEAMDLIDNRTKLSSKNKAADKKEHQAPDYFIAILKKNKTAQEHFNNFSPSHKKEYIQWITEAKTEDTRNKRMTTAIEWLSEGKSRNWKYEKSK